MQSQPFSVEEMIEDCLSEFPSDYVGLWEISRKAKLAFGETDYAREKTLEVVRLLLARGVIAVELTRDGGYIPWPETDPESVISRIRREWIALGYYPDVGDTGWFWLPQSKPT